MLLYAHAGCAIFACPPALRACLPAHLAASRWLGSLLSACTITTSCTEQLRCNEQHLDRALAKKRSRRHHHRACHAATAAAAALTSCFLLESVTGTPQGLLEAKSDGVGLFSWLLLVLAGSSAELHPARQHCRSSLVCAWRLRPAARQILCAHPSLTSSRVGLRQPLAAPSQCCPEAVLALRPALCQPLMPRQVLCQPRLTPTGAGRQRCPPPLLSLSWPWLGGGGSACLLLASCQARTHPERGLAAGSGR